MSTILSPSRLFRGMWWFSWPTWMVTIFGNVFRWKWRKLRHIRCSRLYAFVIQIWPKLVEADILKYTSKSSFTVELEDMPRWFTFTLLKEIRYTNPDHQKFSAILPKIFEKLACFFEGYSFNGHTHRLNNSAFTRVPYKPIQQQSRMLSHPSSSSRITVPISSLSQWTEISTDYDKIL